MGWPCYLGGVVEVFGAASTKFAKPRNCIVFYTPEPAQDMSKNPRSTVRGRQGIYEKTAAFCIGAAQESYMSNQIIALSDIATCIMKAYPDDIGAVLNRPSFDPHLAKLRGVAVYVKYEMPGVIDDIGVSVPEGQIVQNCYEFSFADSLGLKPVFLCHTALMSSVEKDRPVKEDSAPSP